MSKCNSLENINLQFRTIMGKMGLDEEKQNKLAAKMDLAKKIKTIISMQSLDERKKKIKEYLERIENANSLMSILSLHSSIENGSKTLFSIFMTSKGPEVILKSMKVMQGEYVYAVLEFIEMLLHKYDCEIPGLLERVLEKFLEIRFQSPSFYRILEERVKKGEYEILFRNTTSFGCICSSYFSLIVQEIKDGQSSLVDLLRKTERKAYVDYVIKILKGDTHEGIKTPCKSEKLFEIIRIAEEKKMLDLVTNSIETLVLGNGKLPIEINVIEKTDKKNIIKEEIQEKEKEKVKEKLPITTPPAQPKKKIIKKIVKKGPKKNYVQIKWTRMPKEGTIFEKLPTVIEFKEKDLDLFLKVETRPPPTLVKKKESIFPEKRNYALNIALSRVKLTDQDLKRKILSLEDCGANLIKQLLFYFPTEEEIDSLRSLSSPTGRAESFFREALGEIDDLREALNTLNFKILLESQDVLSFSSLSKYYSTILSSTSLREILAFILALGNSLNLTKAEAFSILSLSQVFENRSVLKLLKEKINLKPFLEEFKILFEIQRLSFENLQADIHGLYQTFKRIGKKRKDLEEKYQKIEDKFKETLALHTQAQEYLKDKIDEDFNRQFLEIYQILKSV